MVSGSGSSKGSLRSSVGRFGSTATSLPSSACCPGRSGIPGAGWTASPSCSRRAGSARAPFGPPTRDFSRLDGAIARLRDGVTIEDARREVGQLGVALSQAYPDAYGERGWTPRLIGLRESLVGEVRPQMLLLLAAVGAVLLIACVNVAGLLVARECRPAAGVRRPARAGRLVRQARPSAADREPADRPGGRRGRVARRVLVGSGACAAGPRRRAARRSARHRRRRAAVHAGAVSRDRAALRWPAGLAVWSTPARRRAEKSIAVDDGRAP